MPDYLATDEATCLNSETLAVAPIGPNAPRTVHLIGETDAGPIAMTVQLEGGRAAVAPITVDVDLWTMARDVEVTCVPAAPTDVAGIAGSALVAVALLASMLAVLRRV